MTKYFEFYLNNKTPKHQSDQIFHNSDFPCDQSGIEDVKAKYLTENTKTPNYQMTFPSDQLLKSVHGLRMTKVTI